MKRILCFVFCFLFVLFCCAGCSKSGDNESAAKEDSNKIKVTMADGGSFVIELYPQYAPETCANFKSLVESHFYDGLTFHRVVDHFMAQGGSKDGNGMQGSDKTIKGEFASNGFTQNTLKHTRGVISMARMSGDMNSASSQFFICYDDVPSLDGDYAAFGKVIEGMEVVDAFCNVERTYNSIDATPATPVNPIIIKSMEVI